MLLAGCTVDSPYPKVTGGFKQFVEAEGEAGDGGFIENPELDGALNKVKAGWPVIIGLTWHFDWFLGHKLPGEH